MTMVVAIKLVSMKMGLTIVFVGQGFISMPMKRIALVSAGRVAIRMLISFLL